MLSVGKRVSFTMSEWQNIVVYGIKIIQNVQNDSQEYWKGKGQTLKNYTNETPYNKLFSNEM